MRSLRHLFEKNRAWSETLRQRDPEFFARLTRQQKPEYLWIGCADSRVPANEIVGLMPGEIFVHRNVANVVVHTDLNCLSVLQYAVDVIKVRDVIVCGHYGCGGVQAALRGDRVGLASNWLRHVQDVYRKHETSIIELTTETARSDRLCELNVVEQVMNVCQTTMVMEAWDRGQPLAVHGWIYGLHDGLLRNLELCVARPEEVATARAAALALICGSAGKVLPEAERPGRPIQGTTNHS
jgi:carbonic anhydrase